MAIRMAISQTMALLPRLRIATGSRTVPPPLPSPPLCPAAHWHPSQLRWLYASPIPHRKSRKSAAAQSFTENLGPVPVVLEDNVHSIRDRYISGPAWAVLQRLRSAGHETFLVGGTVRDILLRRTPKDFDVLTSAEAYQVAALFRRAYLLGRRFPICHVHQDGIIIEVSSFSTNAEPGTVPMDAAARIAGKGGQNDDRRSRDRKERRKKSRAAAYEGGAPAGGTAELEGSSTTTTFAPREGQEEGIEGPFTKNKSWEGTRWVEDGVTWAAARRDNAMKRDFTCNGLLYDPFSRTLYDYVGGVKDCESRTLRALGSPEKSFTEDPARVLRAIRLAARTGLAIDGLTSEAMISKNALVSTLSHGRLQMELGAMMSQGAARQSLELLWRYGLLGLLLPHHAVLMQREKVPKNLDLASFSQSGSPPAPTPLVYRLASLLDDQTQAHQPADTSVWVALLLAPLVAAECHTAAKRRAAAAKRRRLKSIAAAAAAGQQEADRASTESITIGDKPAPVAVEGIHSSCIDGESIESDNVIEQYGEGARDEKMSRNWEVPTQEYLEAYNKAIDSAVSRLFRSLNAKTQQGQRASAASSSSRKTGKSEESPGDVEINQTIINNTTLDSILEADGDDVLLDDGVEHESTGDVVVATHFDKIEEDPLSRQQRGLGRIPACLLPRQALETAADILKLEAALRGKSLPAPSSEGKSKGGGRRRGRLERRLAQNEYFVVQLLRRRDVGWPALTDVGF